MADTLAHDLSVIDAHPDLYREGPFRAVNQAETRRAARYIQCRLNGCSHRLAEMLAARKFPALKTDSTFNAGRCNGNQFEDVPGLGDHYKKIAEAAGVSTTGKYYCSGLADFPGDPTAWVSDRGDVLRVAREKNLNVDGDVTHRASEREPIPDIDVADDLIDREVAEILDEDPTRDRMEVREEVRRLRSGEVDPNPLLVSDHNFEDA